MRHSEEAPPLGGVSSYDVVLLVVGPLGGRLAVVLALPPKKVRQIAKEGRVHQHSPGSVSTSTPRKKILSHSKHWKG